MGHKLIVRAFLPILALAWLAFAPVSAAGTNFPAYHQVAALHASDAQAGDWFGYSLAISGDTLIIGAPRENGGEGDPLNWAGAAYVFQRDPGGSGAWSQIATLHASDAEANDAFGFAIAISGDSLAIGAPGKTVGVVDPQGGAGAVYIFERNQGGANAWGQTAILYAPDGQTSDGFGSSVSISGDTLVAGAPGESGGVGDLLPDAGAAYVFQRNTGGNWSAGISLHASDSQERDQFGYAAAISVDTIVVGAPGESGGAGDLLPGAGAAYLFERDLGGPGAWGETAILRASDAQEGDLFGFSVAIDGNGAAVGAANEAGGAGDPLPGAGAAYVFQRNLGGPAAWGEAAILHASDAKAGDWLGWTLTIKGDLVIAGAYTADTPLPDAGAAYVFQRDWGGPDAWGQAAILHASEAEANDVFGCATATDGKTIAIGAALEDGGAGSPKDEAGATYVFEAFTNSYYFPILFH